MESSAYPSANRSNSETVAQMLKEWPTKKHLVKESVDKILGWPPL